MRTCFQKYVYATTFLFSKNASLRSSRVKSGCCNYIVILQSFILESWEGGEGVKETLAVFTLFCAFYVRLASDFEIDMESVLLQEICLPNEIRH